MKTIIEKLESGFYNLDSFSENDKDFLMFVAKQSYNEGLEAGLKGLSEKIIQAIEKEIEESKN